MIAKPPEGIAYALECLNCGMGRRLDRSLRLDRAGLHPVGRSVLVMNR